MAETKFILYGIHAFENDWLKPAEIFSSPDPESTGAAYMLVFNDIHTCKAYIDNVGANSAAMPRPVRMDALSSFAELQGLRLALDVDARGASQRELIRTRVGVEVDADVPSPPPIPPWGEWHLVTFLLVVGATLHGGMTRGARRALATHLVNGGMGSEFVEQHIDEVDAYRRAAMDIGGLPTVFAVVDGFVGLVPQHFGADGLQWVLQGLLATITAEGESTGQQAEYFRSLAGSWGFQA